MHQDVNHVQLKLPVLGIETTKIERGLMTGKDKKIIGTYSGLHLNDSEKHIQEEKMPIQSLGEQGKTSELRFGQI